MEGKERFRCGNGLGAVRLIIHFLGGVVAVASTVALLVVGKF